MAAFIVNGEPDAFRTPRTRCAHGIRKIPEVEC
jgi:hypothetical protein